MDIIKLMQINKQRQFICEPGEFLSNKFQTQIFCHLKDKNASNYLRLCKKSSIFRESYKQAFIFLFVLFITGHVNLSVRDTLCIRIGSNVHILSLQFIKCTYWTQCLEIYGFPSFVTMRTIYNVVIINKPKDALFQYL